MSKDYKRLQPMLVSSWVYDKGYTKPKGKRRIKKRKGPMITMEHYNALFGNKDQTDSPKKDL